MVLKNDIEKIVKLAYLWGRDNGERKSEKNFNDFKETSAYKKLMEEKPLLEGEYFMVKQEKSDKTYVPAKIIYNMIENEKYFKFFDGSEMPCRIVCDYYGI